jgi:riboflavin synthase
MFTGIVTDIGRVRSVRQTERDRRYEIETGWDTSTIDLGASISHAGCCLTVTEKGAGWFAVEVSGETLSKTSLGDWAEGRRINLERAAKLGDELGGHIVSGHVDGLG